MSLPSWERGLKRGNTCRLWLSSNVAPLVGAWIETLNRQISEPSQMSLPSWERGLKLKNIKLLPTRKVVAPLVGAWIETPNLNRIPHAHTVAPLVGAWIETCEDLNEDYETAESLPSWERGLNQDKSMSYYDGDVSRSPRGSVD